eukprot:jgi/Mesvir1/23807/Mv10620-RA.1
MRMRINEESQRLVPREELTTRQKPRGIDGLALVFLSTAISATGPLCFGFALGYTSPSLGDLTKDMGLSLDQAALFGALVNVGAILGAAIGGHIADTFGRVKAIFTGSLPFTLGWLLVATAKEAPLLLVGRVATGVGVGIVSLAVPVYLAEIAPAHLRGTLGSVNQFGVVTGILAVYLAGMALRWRQLALLGTALSGVLLVGTFFLPETPYWLLSHGHPGRAKEAKKRLQGSPSLSLVDEEEGDKVEAPDAQAEGGRSTARLVDLFSSRNIRPVTVGILLMIFQQFSGINAVIFYSGDIFRKAGVTSANSAAMVVAIIQVAMTGIAVWLMDRAGRRVLLLLAEVGMVLSTAALGYCFYDGVRCATGLCICQLRAQGRGLGTRGVVGLLLGLS